MSLWISSVWWLLLGLLSFPVAARDYGELYTAAQLQRAHSVYTPRIHSLLFEDIARYLNGEELETLRRTKVTQPWERTADPFGFSANPETGEILVPTLSVKFLDELSIAIAWFERHGCNKEAVFDYVAALDFGELPLSDPLSMLGVPEKAYELDPYVDDVSQKLLKSAVAFLLLHELGHVHHGHAPYEDVDAEQAQAQEAEADRFALQVLRRMRVPPWGMSVWFLAVSMRDPLAPGSPRQTHPLSSQRLNAISEALRARPGEFIEPANRGRISESDIRAMADEIRRIGGALDDPDLRSFLRERGRRATPALLQGACEPEQHRQDWLDRFRQLLN